MLDAQLNFIAILYLESIYKNSLVYTTFKGASIPAITRIVQNICERYVASSVDIGPCPAHKRAVSNV